MEPSSRRANDDIDNMDAMVRAAPVPRKSASLRASFDAPDATPGDSLCPELLAPTPAATAATATTAATAVAATASAAPIATVPPIATMPPQMAAGAPSCPSGLESSTTTAAGANEGGELQTGQHVQVVGFQKSHTELNGRVGVVTGYDAAKGKYRVRMGPSQVLAFKRSNLVPSTSAE